MQVGRRAMDGVKSAVSQGWLFARPAYSITLKMPQASAGLIGRKEAFAYFSPFEKVGPPEGHTLLAARQRTAHQSETP